MNTPCSYCGRYRTFNESTCKGCGAPLGSLGRAEQPQLSWSQAAEAEASAKTLLVGCALAWAYLLKR